MKVFELMSYLASCNAGDEVALSLFPESRKTLLRETNIQVITDLQGVVISPKSEKREDKTEK